MSKQPTTFVEAQSALAKSLPNYEQRPHQTALATEIEQALASGTPLLAQAGTGTGKSLGYLIPAILSGKRVVVTTATKALQDQLATKDLPFLKEHLGVNFEFAVLKGRASYACLAKVLAEDNDASIVAEVVEYAKRVDPTVADPTGVNIVPDDFFGERTDFPFEIENRDWFKLSSNSDECPGKKECPFGNTCYAERAKAKAQEANVVVVNHALFFIDNVVRERTDGKVSLIGDYDVVIADEAHELESFATDAYGSRFTEWTLRQLVNEVSNFTRREGVYGSVEGALGAINQVNIRFWNSLPTPGRNHNGRLHVAEIVANQDIYVEVIDSLISLKTAIERLHFDDLKADARRNVLLKRTSNLLNNFEILTISDEHEFVRYVEIEKTLKGDDRKVLHSKPISVAKFLVPLWTKHAPILASATLPFDYTAERLGLDQIGYKSFDAGSPFDYPTQARLYVPTHLLDPTPRNKDLWKGQAVDEIEKLVNASGGGALILFTSNSDLNYAHNALADKLPFTVLKQGGGKSNKALAAEFSEDHDSVLFATRSFFTGVDIQGSALRLVIISKLPFPVPSEPVTQARCEVLERDGKNSFSHFTIPEMTLPLQQGFGRLIRHSNDRGVVAILDPRLTSKGYGKGIVRDLPPAPLVTSFGEVEAFFGGDA